MGVKITDYTKVDDIAAKPREYKKVIAQELETVFPQAVSKLPGTVPDIFRKFTADAGFIAVKEPLAQPVKVGDVLKIFPERPEDAKAAAIVKTAKTKTAKAEAKIEKALETRIDPSASAKSEEVKDEVVTVVTEVTKDGFRIKEKLSGNIFIYGRKVEDMRVVDYEAVAMLNVSATQELHRTIEAQAEELKKLKEEKEAMEKKIAGNAAQDNLQEARLAALEKALKLEPPATGPAKKDGKSVAARR
jgi:hypothetical protein